ncbi:class I SAM-dependent methyltransferase [Pseudomonadota bacterium]|nr:class I SAM-dependent methyltransferase [Pseudomonadota bacterium]
MSNLDQAKLEALQRQLVGNIGGAVGLLMAYIGDQAGVYKVLEETGPCTSSELSRKSKIDKRYLTEWLCSNAALGYIDYDEKTNRFFLTPEQAAIFCKEGEQTCMQGFFQAIVSQFETCDKAVETFISGKGREWGEHSSCLFCGTDRFFRPGYEANLLSNWIPSLDGIDKRLKTGGKIADIGCGHGSSTRLLAQHYPNTEVFGYDFHAPSIELASQIAKDEGLDNVVFLQSDAKNISQTGFDLACVFDALHDMGDPVGVSKRINNILVDNGIFMVVEPISGDSLAENLNLLSGIFYGISTTICVPTSRAQEVGLCLGAQAGQMKLTKILKEGNFSSVRRVSETATNMVLEAKK